MASPEKRCLYEVLGLQLDCSPDEIRSAYRKLALQRHPDKLVKAGVSEAQATASFQELVNAYELLSDPRERAWYDSHRSQILFASSTSDSKSKSKSFAGIPDLFSYFSNSVFNGYSDTGKGFYKVYADLFDKIYQNELNFAQRLGLGIGVVPEAPLMGNLKSYYTQVNAFYGYWLGFVTVMDFAWVDQYDYMAGMNRKSRRVMEEENKKLRKKARREYNEMVRNLAEFVKKRDKRVIDMQLKRNEEMEKKREEEKEKKKKLEREKAERARAFVEPEWARVEEEEDVEVEEVILEDEKKNELYCVACSKKFKSDKQWKNHEQSKKHKEKVAELREAFRDEVGQYEEGEDDDEEEVLPSDDGKNGFVVKEDGVDELKEQFEDGLGIQEQGEDDNESQSTEEEAAVNSNNGASLKGIAEELGLEDDDETSVLEAMLAGRKNRKAMRKPRATPKNVHVEVEPEEIDLMEYNNRKGSRRNRGGGKERGKRADEDEEKVEVTESSSKPKEDGDHDEGSKMEEPSSSHTPEEHENDTKGDNDQSTRIRGEENENDSKGDNDQSTRIKGEEIENDSKGDADQSRRAKGSKQALDRKATNKKDATSKLKNAPKGRKQKITSSSSGHECDTCGEDFESRNKLHKHLSDTGHASLKSR